MQAVPVDETGLICKPLYVDLSDLIHLLLLGNGGSCSDHYHEEGGDEVIQKGNQSGTDSESGSGMYYRPCVHAEGKL